MRWLLSNDDSASVQASFLAEDAFQEWAENTGPGTVLQPGDVKSLIGAIRREAKKRLARLYRLADERDKGQIHNAAEAVAWLSPSDVEELLKKWMDEDKPAALASTDAVERVKGLVFSFLTWAFHKPDDEEAS